MRREVKPDELRRRRESIGLTIVLFAMVLAIIFVYVWAWHEAKRARESYANKSQSSSAVQIEPLSSAWLQSMTIPAGCRKQLDDLIVTNGQVPDLEDRMVRADKLKSLIDSLCGSSGINPELVYGLILHESHGDRWAVDFKTKLGDVPVSQAHVGLGQLSQNFLPPEIRDNPARLKAARAWQRASVRRIECKQWPPTARERGLLAKWAALDLRFNDRWNLEKTLNYVQRNLQITGHETLAVLAHLRGTRYPLWWVARYRFDRDRVPYNEADRAKLHRITAPYVKAKGIDLFDLIVDAGAEGSRYRDDRKAQVYCFSVLAWSEIYARHHQAPRPSR